MPQGDDGGVDGLAAAGFHGRLRSWRPTPSSRLQHLCWKRGAAIFNKVLDKPAYGEKAKAFLFAWINCLKGATDGGDLLDRLIGRGEGDTPIVIAYTFPHFIYGYDLLKGSGALTEDEEQHFQRWLQPFVAYHAAEERLRNNHLPWQVVFLMAAVR